MTDELILIIDDSVESRSWLIESVLQPAGYTVLEAASPAEGREHIAMSRPRLIVLDAQIDSTPDAALQLIAQHAALTPIIVTSTHRSLDLVQAALRAGAHDVLIKPFESADMTRSIERALRAHRAARERDELREQTAQQAQEFNALYAIGKNVTALLNLEEVLSLVVTAAVNLIGAEEGSLMLLDPNTGELYLRASRNLVEPDTRNLRIQVNDGLMGRVIQTARPIMMAGNDLLKIRTSFLVKAILSVPLLTGDRVIGVLSVDNKHSRRVFTEHQVHLLSVLAGYAAIAIENAQLYESVRRRANELAALMEIDSHISSTLDFTAVLERIATHARDLLRADDSEVYLLEPDGETLRAVVALGQYAEEVKSQPLRLGEGVVGHIARNQVAELVNDVQNDPRAVRIHSTPDEIEALMCAPLISKGQLMGVMALTRVGEQPRFTPSDLSFLIGLAGQAAIAIENARLYVREQQRAAELAQALAQQRELDRLKNEFVQNVSHELRTPLALVRGYAELLDSGELGDLPSSQREPVTIMARRSRMLSKMLDDLMTFLAVESREAEREAIDLRPFIESATADFQSAARQAGLTLDSDISSRSFVVKGDANQLRRVFDNLLSNAIKFTPSGGRVVVHLFLDISHAVIEVKDTGIGIPADKLDRIFERFYQVDGSATRRYGGIGLGLALVKEIVEAHGGWVTVDSVVGQGSTFRVHLPLMPT